MRVTDFAQVVKDENSLSQVDSLLAGGLSLADVSAKPCTVYDWESPKLSRILSINIFFKKMQEKLCTMSFIPFFPKSMPVPKAPTTSNHVKMLLRLSTIALPSQAASHVGCFTAWVYIFYSLLLITVK